MQEIMLEEQLRAQLSLQDPTQLQQQNLNRPKQQRNRVKKPPKQPINNNEEAIGESLKTEIEMLPTKTPISILQELLSRRGI